MRRQGLSEATEYFLKECPACRTILIFGIWCSAALACRPFCRLTLANQRLQRAFLSEKGVSHWNLPAGVGCVLTFENWLAAATLTGVFQLAFLVRRSECKASGGKTLDNLIHERLRRDPVDRTLVNQIEDLAVGFAFVLGDHVQRIDLGTATNAREFLLDAGNR